MTLHIHNSMTGAKEALQPIEPGKVRMYVCGITVYDYCHLGHARMVVVFDMVARWLRHSGYQLTYARNITDVDDKIIKRAIENSEPMESVTERFIQAMNEDFAPLGVLRPDLEPRATLSMNEMVEMIVTLIAKGHAYASNNGDVYYDVSTFERYGNLSGKNPADLRAGSRIEVNEAKTDPLDFVLWKAAKPGEPAWDSPWGRGRPGWHIECSAMATACFGHTFDIHGGGMDLKFPHHENEIAQSEGATGQRFVNLWMHNGFVQVDEEKMSKSLGNFFTIREILTRYPGEVVRAFILMSHYRSPVNFSDQQLDSARAALDRLYTALKGLTLGSDPKQRLEQRLGSDPMVSFVDRFTAAINDDFNTPVAFSVLFELAREVNRLRDTEPEAAAKHAALLKYLGGLIGFLQDDPEAFVRGQAGAGGLDDGAIESLIAARKAARANRDFAESDRIRDELKAAGILLEDSAAGTTWRRG